MNLKQLIDPITEDDVEWVTELMNLKTLDEPRRKFLKSIDTIDVSACPGSGKTTLVVAKLAILARHWKSRTQGICVLSHTNAAREEIERRLGGTDIGQRLLRYPHFIDTIHGFAGRFLASPWLRSKGIALVAIDDEATHRARRNALTRWELQGIETALGNKHIPLEKLRINSVNFDDPLAGDFIFGAHTTTYKNASKALTKAARAGYFCFDEVFLLANALLDEEPMVAEAIRQRFPCVLVDEMQDTQHNQEVILHRVFPRLEHDLCVIRVGDPNQEIFEKDGASADPFPDASSFMEISSSFRFSQSIATIANPFAFLPISGGLKGLRQTDPGNAIPNTIIVFPDNDASEVLNAYGCLLVEHLPEKVRAAGAYAVGAVHRLENFKSAQYPKSVEHYWAPYQSEVNKSSFRPRTFAEGSHIAQRYLAREATAALAVEMLASCIYRLASLVFPGGTIAVRSRKHQMIEQALVSTSAELTVYRETLHRILFDPMPLVEPEWSSAVVPALLRIAAAVQGQCPPPVSSASALALEFLTWTSPLLAGDPGETGSSLINTFRYESTSGNADIRLSSIHSEKGKTHAATLVLETFNRTHFIQRLLPWLAIDPTKAKRPPATLKKNMMLMYVGMTRPTHMLCLAMRQSTLGSGAESDRTRLALKSTGWSILDLSAH